MATNTRRKTTPKVTPEVEQVVEETTYVEPEEFDLSKQVTVRSIADWSTGFKRITDFGGDLSIPKNGVVRLKRNQNYKNSDFKKKYFVLREKYIEAKKSHMFSKTNETFGIFRKTHGHGPACKALEEELRGYSR